MRRLNLRRATAAILFVILVALIALRAISGTEIGGESDNADGAGIETADISPGSDPPADEPVSTPYPPYAYEGSTYEYDGVVEHLFFHPVITYTELAFDGDHQEAGLDEYMVTVDEYKKILQSLYNNDYILVNMNDVWTETTDENGNAIMQRNTLTLPEGKKPLILSYDDVNYYKYMLDNGFTYKLIIGEDGELWSWGLDPDGNEVMSQELDAVTILDKFVEEHPDFSWKGAKGLLCLTGYEGILGYRTNTSKGNDSADFEANRQKEIEAVKPIVQKLKDTGWYFGSHTFGHITLGSSAYNSAIEDMDRWLDEVGSLVGPTTLLIYPYGSRPDGDDVQQSGAIFTYYQSKGFRVFSSVGYESYSKIKTDICAVICDRMHADGGTLRRERDRYLKFYDAAEVFDDSRPDFGTNWQQNA